MHEAILEGKVFLAHQKHPILKPIAEQHHIPYTTFLERLARADENGNVPNRNENRQKLTPAQEDQLIQYVVDRIYLGRETTKSQFMEMVNRIGKHDSPDFSVGEKWYTMFMKRQNIIEYNEEGYFELIGVKETSYDVIKDWTERYHKVVVEGNVKPCNIYNMDEINVRIAKKRGRKLFKLKEKGPRKTERLAGTSYVTVVETISMSGAKLTPKAIFASKNELLSWYDADNIPHFNFDILNSGWITKDLACDWLKRIFIPESGAGNVKDPVVLILEDYSAHKTPEFMTICEQNNIKLLFLPSNTSHLTQPLDECPFAIIENKYSVKVSKKVRNVETRGITKNEFIKIYNEARESTLTESMIKKAWEQVGLFGNNYDILFNNVTVINNPNSSVNTPFEEFGTNNVGTMMMDKLSFSAESSDVETIRKSMGIVEPRPIVQFYRFMKYIDGLRSERAELEKQLENKIEETVELIAEDPEAIDMESTLLSPILDDIGLEVDNNLEEETKTSEKRKEFVQMLKETLLTDNKRMKLSNHRDSI